MPFNSYTTIVLFILRKQGHDPAFKSGELHDVRFAYDTKVSTTNCALQIGVRRTEEMYADCD